MQENLPRLDLAGALDAMDNDREMYRNILDVYLSSIPPLLTEMLSALSRNDLPSAVRSAHSLKSSSRLVGALNLGAEAESFEQSAPSLSQTELLSGINLLQMEFNLFCTELTNEGFEVPSPL